jgi:peptidoglycan-N-acetylglucosamine deacetylase
MNSWQPHRCAAGNLLLGVILLSVVVLFPFGRVLARSVPTERPERKSFMISFDDGPAPVSTPYILDQLRGIAGSAGNPVRAGFFLVGKDKKGSRTSDIWTCEKKIRLPFFSRYREDLCPDPGVEGNADIVRSIEREGHYVLVHGQHHADLRALSPTDAESEVSGCYEELRQAGVTPLPFFRPPYLSIPAVRSDSILMKDGWRIILGTPSGDGNPFATDETVIAECRSSIERATAYPVILIFHDFRGRPGHRLDFKRIIGALIDSGYELRDFDPEMVGRRLIPVQ